MDKIKQVIHIDNVKLSDDKKAVILIDQTRLPNQLDYITVRTPEQLYEAIFELKVRGAPAIGIAAAYGIYCLAQQIKADNYEDFYKEFHKLKVYIESSRPTAVNLSWALKRMEGIVISGKERPITEIIELLEKECRKIHEEDIAMCRAISEYGLTCE